MADLQVSEHLRRLGPTNAHVSAFTPESSATRKLTRLGLRRRPGPSHISSRRSGAASLLIVPSFRSVKPRLTKQGACSEIAEFPMSSTRQSSRQRFARTRRLLQATWRICSDQSRPSELMLLSWPYDARAEWRMANRLSGNVVTRSTVRAAKRRSDCGAPADERDRELVPDLRYGDNSRFTVGHSQRNQRSSALRTTPEEPAITSQLTKCAAPARKRQIGAPFRPTGGYSWLKTIFAISVHSHYAFCGLHSPHQAP